MRYLFSKKSHGAVNVISVISVIGVAVATMAIVIVLSVFNGFSELAAKHLAVLDPQIKVKAAQGKAIADADYLASELQAMPQVRLAIPTVEERGLLIYDKSQMPVIFKGVPDSYNQLTPIDSAVIDGSTERIVMDYPAATLSAGIAIKTGARPGFETVIDLYVPRRVGKINPANPAASFRSAQMLVSGVFQTGHPDYDTEYMLIPLSTARDLLEYDTESTYIEIALEPGTDIEAAASGIRQRLGSEYTVLTRMQQQEQAFRMIAIEKWVTFLMLAFILVIASFNIISTLSLLVIEKRSNMATLRAIGAPKRLVRSIFMVQGWLISVVGGVIGIVIGSAMALAQQHFELIKLSGDPSNLSVSAYPVRVEPTDLLIILGLVVIVGAITSQITRLFTKDIKTIE